MTIRLIALGSVVAILITLNVGCGAKSSPPAAASIPPAVSAETTISPEDITQIRLVQRHGFGVPPKVSGNLILVRDKQSEYYFHRLAKALIDNGFFRLKARYPTSFVDGPSIEITVTHGDKETGVVNDDYGSETDPTYLFEMLIRGADADIKIRRSQEKD